MEVIGCGCPLCFLLLIFRLTCSCPVPDFFMTSNLYRTVCSFLNLFMLLLCDFYFFFLKNKFCIFSVGRMKIDKNVNTCVSSFRMHCSRNFLVRTTYQKKKGTRRFMVFIILLYFCCHEPPSCKELWNVKFLFYACSPC